MCPQQVRLKHLDKAQAPPIQRIDFTKGNAAHLVLKRIAEALNRGDHPMDDAQIMGQIRRELPRWKFPSEEEWLAHLGDVARWIRRGRRYIERDSVRKWVWVERPLERRWNLVRGMPPFTISARPDLIVRHEDDEGVPVVEIIDYKTGAQWFDEMPALMLRLVARELLDGLVGNTDEARIQFTYLWLESGQEEVIDLTAEYIEYYWTHVERQMRRLVTETDWKPAPSPGCRSCPFFENVCTEKVPIDRW